MPTIDELRAQLRALAAQSEKLPETLRAVAEQADLEQFANDIEVIADTLGGLKLSLALVAAELYEQLGTEPGDALIERPSLDPGDWN